LRSCKRRRNIVVVLVAAAAAAVYKYVEIAIVERKNEIASFRGQDSRRYAHISTRLLVK
jgi:hypothetical protein